MTDPDADGFTRSEKTMDTVDGMALLFTWKQSEDQTGGELHGIHDAFRECTTSIRTLRRTHPESTGLGQSYPFKHTL